MRAYSLIAKLCMVAGCVASCLLPAYGQDIRATSADATSGAALEIRALTGLVQSLQSDVRTLNSELADLRREQARAEEVSRELRRELELVKSGHSDAPKSGDGAAPAPSASVPPEAEAPERQSPAATVEDRLSRLEDDQQVLEGKVNDEYQTKVESGSKYRVRLSGIVLLNLFSNRGQVDNQDFPLIAESPQQQPYYVSAGTFGGSLRQSQIHVQAFGPDVAGAHTSADLQFDFAGEFPNVPNGVAFGIMRLRTGALRFDWTNTSLVAGQDPLFFAPLAPASLSTLAIPPLAYSGKLWAWVPQLRLEHRFHISENSDLLIQGGILDALTGDIPYGDYGRYPSWGEMSGQPAYATRMAWSHTLFGEKFTMGGGGYYARQNWGLSRTFDSWAGTTDLTVPLGKWFEFTGEFYRGRGVAGLGGGIGQSVLLSGPFTDPATLFRGLDSAGGWAQLKFKATPKLEMNGAAGLDSPFANELREFSAHSIYPESYTRNFTPLVNFIYQLRSDLLVSIEYRRITTSVLDGGSFAANHVDLNLGYIF